MLPARSQRASRQIQVGIADRQNPIDRVWAICAPRSSTAGGEQAGYLYLSGVHIHLWADTEGRGQRAAANDTKGRASKRTEPEKGTTQTLSPTNPRKKWLGS